MENKFVELQSQIKILNDKLQTADERIVTLENLYYESYSKQEADLKGKQALNVIIRGVPEERDERLHVLMGELLAPVKTIDYTQTNGASRLGRPSKQTQQRGRQSETKPRPISLRCMTVLQKGGDLPDTF